MEYLGTAVRKIRKDKHLTLEDIANQMQQYDSGNFSRFERGQQSIDAEKLQEMAKILNVSVSEIYALAEQLQREAAGAKPKAEEPRHQQDGAAGVAFALVPPVSVQLDAAGRAIASVDGAGVALPIPRLVLDKLSIKTERAAVVRVKGDAMDATLADGDDALIDHGDTNVESGKVYALLVQDEVWVRRLVKSPAGITLRADNANGTFPDHHMTTAEFAQQLKVIGRVRLRWGTAGL